MVLITSTCLFLAYVIRRKCLGKKGEGLKEHGGGGRPSATGAGGVLSPPGIGGGAGAWVRRHGKAIVGAAIVLGLASAGALVASRRTRAALLAAEAGEAAGVVGAGVGEDVSAFLLPDRQKERQPPPPPPQELEEQQPEAVAAAEEKDGDAVDKEEGEEASSAASAPPLPAQCRVAAVAPACPAAQQLQQAAGSDAAAAPASASAGSGGQEEWARALGKLAGATNATSLADLVVFPSSIPSTATGAIWPPADAIKDALLAASSSWAAAAGEGTADVHAYVGGVVAPSGTPGAAAAAAAGVGGAPLGRTSVAFLPAPWDPLGCPAVPRWKCEGADDAPRAFDLVVLRGAPAAAGGGGGGGEGAAALPLLRLPAGEEGAALLRAVVLGGGAGKGKGKGKGTPPPRFVAMAVPAAAGGAAKAEAADAAAAACPDACGGKAAAVVVRPECAPWRFPAPAVRVPVREGMELAVYRVVEDLGPLVGAWPAEGGLC